MRVPSLTTHLFIHRTALCQYTDELNLTTTTITPLSEVIPTTLQDGDAVTKSQRRLRKQKRSRRIKSLLPAAMAGTGLYYLACRRWKDSDLSGIKLPFCDKVMEKMEEIPGQVLDQLIPYAGMFVFSRVLVEGGNWILDAWDAISPPDKSAYDDDDDDDEETD